MRDRIEAIDDIATLPEVLARIIAVVQDESTTALDLADEIGRDQAPPGYFDLGQMLKDLIANGVSVKVCGTCKARCGRFRNEPYFDGAREATMNELAEWVRQADRILTF